MFQSVGRERVRQLIEEGAQVLEVLEGRQYRLAHLPGAVHIPAWELTRDRAAQELDADRPVVVYCFDTLWDLSPRAACLLERYGFTDVYDYVDGKVEWMAYGLPVEGEDGPFIGDQAVEIPTCDVGATVAGVRPLLPGPVVVVAGGLAVGLVEEDDVEGRSDGAPVLDLMRPVPSTYRPSVTVGALADDGGGGRHLVSTPDGRLLGAVTVEAGEHDHDHGGDGVDRERFERELTEVLEAAGERFGDREPTEAELRDFLRDRLVADGRSPEDADRLLDTMET